MSAATKHATAWYNAEKAKPNGLSTKTVSKRAKAQHGGLGPSESTILRMVKMGKLVCPLSRGERRATCLILYSKLLARLTNHM